jgi:phage tail-like protein
MTRPDPTLPRERLDARIGWQEAGADGLVREGDRLQLANAVTLADGTLVFAQPIPDTDPAGSFGGRTLAHGLAISGQGDVYLGDPEGARVLYTRAAYPPKAEPDSPIAPFVALWQFPVDPGPHPLALTRPVDLALVPVGAPVAAMADTLVIADADRLLWLDRRQIVVRHELTLPGQAIGLGVDATGRVRVAVRSSGNVALITVVRGTITRIDPLIRLPHSVYVHPDGTALLANFDGVWGLDLAGRTVDPAALFAAGSLTPPALSLVDGTLLFADGCPNREPLRLNLPTDRYGALKGTALSLLTLPRKLPRPRRGTWYAGPFDGDARAFPWHRIALEAEVPDQCRLVVSTATTDFATDLTVLQVTGGWTGGAAIGPGDPTEALIQANKGRYLWLRIEAFGNGAATASIAGIDIYGPRKSQLALLPAPFRQDPESADFLDRFLSLQDEFLTEVLQLFASVGAILRPVATPVDFLDWLGGWFDWTFLAEWDAATRRDMIAQSMVFFAERGTIAGLQRMLQWHTGLTGPLPVILEGYLVDRATALPWPDGTARSLWLGGADIGTEADGAHHFSVILPADAASDSAARDQIDRIIAAQKPAHTTHSLFLIRPGLTPGRQGLLGIDSILPDSRPQPLGKGELGNDLMTLAAC